jgi:hypothetical protein
LKFLIEDGKSRVIAATAEIASARRLLAYVNFWQLNKPPIPPFPQGVAFVLALIALSATAEEDNKAAAAVEAEQEANESKADALVDKKQDKRGIYDFGDHGHHDWHHEEEKTLTIVKKIPVPGESSESVLHHPHLNSNVSPLSSTHQDCPRSTHQRGEVPRQSRCAKTIPRRQTRSL